MQKDIKYLGYSLTTEGVKPQRKKVEGMKRIKKPTTPKQLKSFLGLVNFYRDVWKKRFCIVAPHSKLSSVKPKDWTWGRKQEHAFRKIKEVSSKEAILDYSNFDKPFHLYTDASGLQLGKALVQGGKPLGYYTRKLNKSQQNYTTGEKELLSVFEGLKAFL